MTLSLDTNVVIDLLGRGQLDLKDRHRTAATSEGFRVCAIVAHELAYGAEKGGHTLERRRQLTELLGDRVAAITQEDAEAAGLLRADLGRKRLSLSLAVLLIGAQARRRGWRLVTHNVRHLGLIPGLTLIDWRVSDAPLTPEHIAGRIAGAET